MKTFFECIPCFVRQSLDAVRLVTDDETIHERVLREVLRAAAGMDMQESPPAMGQYIHRMIRELTGSDDPYRQIKDRCNRLALEMLPALKNRVEQADDPLAAAVRLAIAGNIIDFGVNHRLQDDDVHNAVAEAMTAPLDAATVEEFSVAVDKAENIFFLGDNAGEIVFDRLLIEQLPREKITYVVKGSPVINDATMADAEATGMTGLVEVIDNGSDAPGTIMKTCNQEFRRRFDDADLIVAKGQGNYETLSDVEANIFFLLKAKCPVIAGHIGCEVGSMILLGNERRINCRTKVTNLREA